MDLTVSTSWNATDEPDSGSERANRIVYGLLELGFDRLELSFKLDSSVVDNIKGLVKSGIVKVDSLHNICPIPDDVDPEEASPDYYSLSSIDESERALAVKYAKRTIETAAELGARAVVLHLGKVEIEGSRKALIELYKRGLKGTKEYNDLMSRMAGDRNRLQDRYLKAVVKSLHELIKPAGDNSIKLGVETRIYFREIPSFEEVGVILEEFKGSDDIGYWHDTGHAQVYEELGFGKHTDFLESYHNRMIGFHLHDIKGVDDHLAPGCGDFDFSILKKYIKKGMLTVMEPHRPSTKEELLSGAIYLEKLLS